MSRQPISQEGYEKLRAQIKELEEVEMPKIAQKIADARAEGDLSENAEYHAQREAQGLLQAKINLLKSQLANSVIVDKSSVPKGIVAFGCVVTVRDLDDGMEEKYEFVGHGETDYDGEIMKILCTSPLAVSLMGKKAGDQVEVPLPRGTQRLEIVAVDSSSED
ncbi:MAG: transcription elongation factor GreA [Planctomycetaceae bacterium]|nr:transcription elongation factor GreA [Planctomycetaceae bacterium]